MATNDAEITQQVLDNIKIISNLKDDDPRIKSINVYIQNAIDEIELYLNIDSLDKKLSVIVQKMAQNAVIQESFEGTKSVSEEGLSLTFNDTDLDPYLDILNSYLDGLRSNSHRGAALSFD
ncbi:phage head-tail connector protein [Companilactobacillus baiquanensis]|uniref:Phage head-tail connector protein n=1 Tax=Companilactobacillus baiquanensis TaxID=2486005 RepID=A0ABW1UZ46_9LACO|nr:phage head-tail connector protein [Companilactobacillus baiquanensis]